MTRKLDHCKTDSRNYAFEHTKPTHATHCTSLLSCEPRQRSTEQASSPLDRTERSVLDRDYQLATSSELAHENRVDRQPSRRAPFRFAESTDLRHQTLVNTARVRRDSCRFQAIRETFSREVRRVDRPASFHKSFSKESIVRVSPIQRLLMRRRTCCLNPCAFPVQDKSVDRRCESCALHCYTEQWFHSSRRRSCF